MWAAIRSDLSEFVSGVAEESNNVITTATSNENPTTPTKESTIIGEDGDVLDAGFDSSGVIASAADEAARRRNHPETYLEPLDENDPDVQAFLDTFDIEGKTDEIAELLKENPETLQKQFDSLATEVSYPQFWQRYFYRCDQVRIAEQWKQEEKDAKQARAQAITGGINTVRDLFGGAVKAVSKVVTKEGGDEVVPSSPFLGDNATSPAVALSFFGANGRPPFVMNTAVDDDEDEIEEEEDEEELGWDDDDDEEEEEEEEGFDEGESEEITFSGGKFELNRLQEQLKTMEEERNQLRETVDLQKKEINALRAGEAPTSENSTLVKEVEDLKMQLFEKDSELGALKASLEDTHDQTRNESLRKAKAHIASLERDLEKATKAQEDAEAELGKTFELWEATKAEWETVKKQLEDTQTELHKQTQALETTRAQLQESQQRCAELDIMKKEDQSAATSSTGVKVSTEEEEGEVGEGKAGNDVEDDWGDDW